MKQRVLISGAGPAGLATALLLDKEKYEIKIVEKSDSFNTMGFSIILWKTGYEILKKTIGADVDFSSSINSMKIFGGEDYRMYYDTDITGFAHSVRRKDLIDHLSKKYLQIFENSDIRFNTKIKDIDNTGDQAKVSLSSGEQEEYDLVICADGMHSDIRSKHFESKISSGPYKIVYEWIKPGSGLSEESIVGFQRGIVYLIQTFEDRALLAYYLESNKIDAEEFEAEMTERLGDKIGGKIEIDTESKQVFAGEEVEVKQWYKNKIVLIGDASHGHPPTIAMGTSMALEDADALARFLNSNDDYEHAIREYNLVRRRRVGQVYRAQNLVEEMFLTNLQAKIEFSEFFLQAGGKFLLEHYIREIVDTKIMD